MSIRKRVQKLVRRLGATKVEELMLQEGIPSSTRTRLVKDTYPSEPKGLLLATLEKLIVKAEMYPDKAS